MISQRFINLLIWRFRLSVLYSYTVYLIWDFQEERFVATHGPLFWNALVCISFGIAYNTLLGLHLIYKPTMDEDWVGSGSQLAAYILGWTEFIALITILSISAYAGFRRSDLIKMYNEIWSYTKSIQDQLNQSGRTKDPFVLRTQKMSETLLKLIFLTSVVVPFGYVLCLSSELEPGHVLLSDLLEIDVSLSWKYFSFLLTLTLPVFACFVLIYYVIALFIMYVHFLETSIYLITPTYFRLVPVVPKCKPNVKYRLAYEFSTPIFPNINESELILLFRIQQTFNRIINDIWGNVFVSQHQLGFMCIFVGLFYTIIHGAQEIRTGGLIFLITFCSMIVFVLSVQLMVSHKSGYHDDLCKRFVVDKGTRILNRKLRYCKFLLSCWNLKSQIAYPFYDISRETFPQFVSEGLGFFVTLSAI